MSPRLVVALTCKSNGKQWLARDSPRVVAAELLRINERAFGYRCLARNCRQQRDASAIALGARTTLGWVLDA